MRTFSDVMETILSCGIVEDVGQIPSKELRRLNKAVKAGLISKGKGGEFPIMKTVFAPNGFDFTAHRNAVTKKVKDAESGQMSKWEYITHKFNYASFIRN